MDAMKFNGDIMKSAVMYIFTLNIMLLVVIWQNFMQIGNQN